MKIALVHDFFNQMGGAERVVDAMHEMFPEAPVYTLVFDPKFSEKYKGWDIRTSDLQTLYLALGNLQYLLPLIPYGVDSFDFSGYDVVLSSSSGFVKNLRQPQKCLHINYCHTPTRFLWSDPDYVKYEVNFFLRPFVKMILKKLKQWDYKGAQRVNFFIANSKEVKGRIQKYYNRDSYLIYPFIDNQFWKPVSNKGNYFLLAGRLQPYKNNQMVIEVFNDLGLPLHVVGTGREEDYLKSIAKPNIKFFGYLNDEDLRMQYSGALGYVYPQIEDFGLMPVEAAACGTATLAFGFGGALETVIPGKTGEFFYEANKSVLKKMVSEWKSEKYSKQDLLNQASFFSKEKFKQNMADYFKKNIK